ncbi:MAG: hypothetical protein U0105_08485 [Candidatus Obscuribacterales bacterium]
MRINLTNLALAASTALVLGAPAMAQDVFGTADTGATGATNSSGNTTLTQTQMNGVQQASNCKVPPTVQSVRKAMMPPSLWASTLPVQFKSTTSANLEALLNIIANGMEILGIAWADLQ